MAVHKSSPTLVGRDRELDRLRQEWAVTRTGEPQLILISGEAGVGKTRLMRAFAELVTNDEGQVLSGVCVDLREGGLPYAPIRQALRAVMRSDSDHGRRLVAAHSDALAALLPDLGDATSVTAAGAQSRRVHLFESLLALFSDLATRAPLLLVVDDVQWADQATLDLLTFLASNLTGISMLGLLAFRDDQLVADDPLSGFLVGRGSGTVRERITLDRLSERAVAEQIACIVDHTPDPRLVEVVFERSDGNPFFVEELLAADTTASGDVPPTVKAVLLRRLETLPITSRQALRVAAVAGRTVAHDALAHVADLPERELSEALRAAIAAQVLEIDDATDGYAFRHTLLREHIYHDVLPTERRRLHRRYASHLSSAATEEPSIIGAVATHHDLGGEPALALPAYMAAADTAERSFAFADAERYLRRAVELWDVVADTEAIVGTDKVSVLGRAVDAALAVEDAKQAIAFARSALEHVDDERQPARAGLLLSRLGTALWLDGEEQQAHDAYATALQTVPVSPHSRERAEVLAYRAAMLAWTGRLSEAHALASEAIAVARRAGAVAEECRPLLTAGSTAARLGDLQRGLRFIDQAQAIARDHNLAIEAMRVHLHRGRALQAYAAWDEALTVYTVGAAEAPKLGMARRYVWRFQVLAARMLFKLGRWDESGSAIREAREQHVGERATLPELLVATGDWVKATEWFAKQPSRWRSDGSGLFQHPEARVDFATWQGADDPVAYDDALEHCAELLALVADSEDPLPAARLCVAGLRAHADLAQSTGADQRSPAPASRLHDRLDQLATAHPPRRDGWGQELRALAITGTAEFARVTGAGAAALWHTATTAWEALAMPYPASYARFRHGQALLSNAETRTRGAELLRTARAVAEGLGAAPLIRAIAECAARAGLGDAPPSGREQPDGNRLTRREQQVLELLIDGLSNREIAEQLFITEGTASVHVSHILRKLGVSSRHQAIAILLRGQRRD